MKGLLLKDLYMTAKYFRPYFLIALFFIAASPFANGNLFFIYYPCMLCGMLPANLQSYDERSKWETFSQALPYTKVQIVCGKYLIGLAAQLTVILPTAIVQAIQMHLAGTFSRDFFLAIIASLLSMAFVTSAIPLPFIFKYGVEKGRVAQYLLIAIVCGGSAAASIWFGESLPAIQGFRSLPLLICLAAACLYALSWYLSIVFYRKREAT